MKDLTNQVISKQFFDDFAVPNFDPRTLSERMWWEMERSEAVLFDGAGSGTDRKIIDIILDTSPHYPCKLAKWVDQSGKNVYQFMLPCIMLIEEPELVERLMENEEFDYDIDEDIESAEAMFFEFHESTGMWEIGTLLM